MKEFKKGDHVERRYFEYGSLLAGVKEKWEPALYDHTDHNGHHIITRLGGKQEMLPKGTQDLR